MRDARRQTSTPHTVSRAFAILAIALSAAAMSVGAAACGGDASGPGNLVFGQSDGIYEFSLSDNTQKLLFAPIGGNKITLRDPALSPDGKRVAYVYAFPLSPLPDHKFDASTDIWVANRDGSDAHGAYKHDTPNQLVLYPRWLDNQHLISVVRIAAEANANVSVPVTLTLERIDAATGERTKLLDNVTDFGLSPDRKRIAYTKIAPGVPDLLMIADIDPATGAIINEALLAGADQHLGPFMSPRFSPDGKTVAFGSPEQPAASAAQRYVTAAGARSADAATLHGLPQDVLGHRRRGWRRPQTRFDATRRPGARVSRRWRAPVRVERHLAR